MKKLFFLLLISLFCFNVAFAANETVTVNLFYGQGCPHCGRVEPFIDQLEEKYPDVSFNKYEVYNDWDNLILLNDYFDIYGVSERERGVPVVFVSNKYLLGDRPILTGLESEIQTAQEQGSAEPVDVEGVVGDKSPMEKLQALSLGVVAGAALVDSINPCAIAVLIILLGAILAAGDKKRALGTGLAFTVSIYIVYFLFGIGLFSAIQISGLSFYFYKLIGLFAIIIGIFNIKDYFWYGGCGFVTEIPRSWRPTMKKIIKGVTSPVGAFIAGFAVSLFELPCTGGPYIFILGLLAEKTTRYAAMPILLFYNLIFILPLIIINFAVYFGWSNVEKTEKWRQKNIKKLHLVAGTIMLLLGITVIFFLG